MLGANQSLILNQALYSCDGRFGLVMQSDGNLVLYRSGVGPLWATNTTLKNGQTTAILQGDGNLVLYDAANHPLWQSNTAGWVGAYLEVQSDGDLVIFNPSESPVWTSGIGGL